MKGFSRIDTEADIFICFQEPDDAAKAELDIGIDEQQVGTARIAQKFAHHDISCPSNQGFIAKERYRVTDVHPVQMFR